uniref:Uncharacterized protein n=1 Tax=Arion vulgaris TaxID=1028688 RepID=A0A0B7ARF5_9EUPU
MASANGDIVSAEYRKAQTEESQKAVTSFMGMYLIVSFIVAFAWLLGYFDFSFLWVFISIASLFIIWKAKIGKIIAQHLSNEEATLYRKRAFRQNETAEWFNFLLNRWWVFSSNNIEELVKKHFNERLWDIRPSFVDSLELVTFSVGEQTPNIKNLRTFECSESTPGSLQPISWFNVHCPPAGLDKLSSYQVVVEADISMMSDDFKMIFRGRVGSSRVSVGFDMVVEDLHLSGTVQAVICLSMDVPFPHMTKATVSFKERPEVTFNIRLLKALSLMEIPLLKSWIHNNVMEGLTKAMVDPASVDIQIKKVGPTLMGQNSSKKTKAQGVLTVHIKGYPPRDGTAEDIRYTVLNIGHRKRQTHEVPATVEWEDVCSFFIYNLATEKIRIKSKCMRLITSTTLEQNDINLSSFPLQVRPVCETTVACKDGSKINMTMQFTSLPAVSLTDLESHIPAKVNGVAGVMLVCIHGATNVLVADKTGASDPYCVLFCNRKRVLTTPFVPRTRNPRWESWVEFFVADYTKSSLSFFVYDWDGTNTINDDFLGSVHISLTESQPEMIKRTLILGYNKPEEGFVADTKCGHITVSVVFRSVPSVANSERFREVMKSYKPSDYLYSEDLMSPSSVASLQGRRSTTTAYMDELLSDKIIVELTILQGKDMMAMDRNGFSDPFCVVSVKGKKVFTTTVKKKTLFPKWNETVTTEMSLLDSPSLTIDVFDKDVISKDFMGKLTLSIDQLKELSIKGTSDWFTLEKIKIGQLQLKCQVISKDTFSAVPDAVFTDNSVDSHKTSMEQLDLNLNSPMKNSLKSGVRSSSEQELDKGSQDGPGIDKQQSTLPRKRSPTKLTRSDSSNSVNVMQRNWDQTSLNSSVSVTEKAFCVTGKVLHVRSNIPLTSGIYCKVRLEIPGSRLSLFHHTRIIGKSKLVNVSENMADCNVSFEVDRGAGVTVEAVLTFDLKHSNKQHLATKSFSLRSLLADSGTDSRWIQIGKDIAIEISISHGQASPRHHRRSGSILKSLSFRKDKPN